LPTAAGLSPQAIAWARADEGEAARLFIGAELADAVHGLLDGLENPRAVNLLSYKSHHEALDAWSLDELIGYYVLYRKVNLTAEDTSSSPASVSGCARGWSITARAIAAPRTRASLRISTACPDWASTKWPLRSE
jgi:hypothetical protein